jgi:hypothetical protein
LPGANAVAYFALSSQEKETYFEIFATCVTNNYKTYSVIMIEKAAQVSLISKDKTRSTDAPFGWLF